MAKHVVQRITDDLDGSPDAATIQFSLDGHVYEIDLGPRSEAKFRNVLAPFIDHATAVSNGRKTTRSRESDNPTMDHAGRQRAGRARQWALDNGVELPARGRIARAVLDALDDDNVPALYEAVGLDYQAAKKPKRSARKATQAKFKAS
jgi:hypothetical protein